MSKRRTIKIKELVEHVNSKLVNESLSRDSKITLCCLLEFYLHETGNYAGYNHNFDWNTEPDRLNREYERHYYYKG